MAEPFLAEIRLFAFGFPPKGWAFCDGQILPINQNQALFSLLGTTFGGDGRITFALPDLRGRVPLHSGVLNLGAAGGLESVSLGIEQLGTHSHPLVGDAAVGSKTDPSGNLLAKKRRFGADVYGAPTALTGLGPQSVAPTGGGQPHSNLQPSLVLSFAIALVGIFPARN